MNYLIKKIFSIFSRNQKQINLDKLKKILHGILSAREDEISCDECFSELDEFVELKLKGKDPAKALPLVQDHLNRCRDCREEFETLLEVLKDSNISQYLS